MKELGPAAREFVESHRGDRPLADAARARIKQNLMLRVSTLAGTTAVAGTAAGMSLASKVVLVTLAVTGAVGAGSLSLWALRSRAPANVTVTAPFARTTARDVGAADPFPAPPLNPAATPRVAAPGMARGSMATPARAAAAAARAAAPGRTAPRVAAAPATAPRSTTTATVVSAPASVVSVPLIDDRPVAPIPENPIPAAARAEAPDPEPELRTLREARDDLRAGHPARAYRRLEDFNRQSPGGMLAQERSALSAIALCQAQPGRDAQARAAEFMRRSPESPLAARVKSACDPAREAVRKDSP